MIFQALGYLGSINSELTEAKGVDAVAFYIGFNLPIIFASILFLVSLSLKMKIKKAESYNEIDSIGKN